jgi:asparagine synthase (glutamine-hydrolysing)
LKQMMLRHDVFDADLERAADLTGMVEVQLERVGNERLASGWRCPTTAGGAQADRGRAGAAAARQLKGMDAPVIQGHPRAMCGLAWYLLDRLHGKDGQQTRLIEDRLANAVAHRGPDQSTQEVHAQQLWAFHRLAVVDGVRGGKFTPNGSGLGMQPMTSAAGSRLVCNGEIYNHAQLAAAHDLDVTRSDCEVILLLLDRAVASDSPDAIPEALDQLDGDFAFVYVRPAEGAQPDRLIVARDPVGVCPLFYAVDATGDVCAVASEAKALVGLTGTDGTHLRVSVFPPGFVYASFAGLGWAASPTHASFAGLGWAASPTQRAFRPYVPVEPPAWLLRLDAEDAWAAECEAIARLPPARPLDATTISDLDAAAYRVRQRLTCAVGKRLAHGTRPVGVLCSGGIDSAVITWIAAHWVRKQQQQQQQRTLHVFTIEYEGARSQDAFYARLLCQALGLQHTVFSFTRSEVLEALPHAVAACETYDPRTVRAAIPMLLLARRIRERTDVRIILSGEGADELFHGYKYFGLAPTGDDARAEAARLVRNLHMFDLLRADRCFAASGIEVRVPFLDRALVRYVQTLDPAMWRGKPEKTLLRRAFADAAELCNTRILERGKECFSDGCGFTYVPHLLSDLSGAMPHLSDRLHAESVRVHGVFDELYPGQRHLVVERTMPAWTDTDAGHSTGLLM